MTSVIRENVRKIIGKEDYLKLRAEQLDDVKRRIRLDLNALLDADVVEDVVFDKWNVIP
jgi:flagellar basal body-associated protein FliL